MTCRHLRAGKVTKGLDCGIIHTAAELTSAAVILRSVVMPAQVGDAAPDFKLPSPEHGEISLSQYRGDKTVVLSFHVFDFTSG